MDGIDYIFRAYHVIYDVVGTLEIVVLVYNFVSDTLNMLISYQ